MVAIASGLDTVIVRVVRPPRGALEERGLKRSMSSDGRTAEYLALLYGRADLPLDRPSTPPPGHAAELSREPLAGVASFVISWGLYNEYLATYVEGGKGAYLMRERLFEALPDNLKAVLAGDFASQRRTRTWFSSEAPELDELPWELVAFAGGRTDSGGSFVRGLPPSAATPLVPVGERLRMAVLDPLGATPQGLTGALDALGAAVETVRFDGSVREALRRVAAGGFELVHIVSDGSVTASYDGVLDFPETRDAQLTASEAASLLRGSSVRVLGLTAARSPDPALTAIGSWRVPSVHRAFTYFGTSPMPLPNIVAPLGPLGDDELHLFWQTFYEHLAATHELESSMTRAQAGGPLAVALFLRQLQLPTFRQVAPSSEPMAEPAAAKVKLEASRELVDQLQALQTKHGVRASSLDVFVDKERERQSELEAEVDEWVEGVDEE